MRRHKFKKRLSASKSSNNTTPRCPRRLCTTILAPISVGMLIRVRALRSIILMKSARSSSLKTMASNAEVSTTITSANRACPTAKHQLHLCDPGFDQAAPIRLPALLLLAFVLGFLAVADRALAQLARSCSNQPLSPAVQLFPQQQDSQFEAPFSFQLCISATSVYIAGQVCVVIRQERCRACLCRCRRRRQVSQWRR